MIPRITLISCWPALKIHFSGEYSMNFSFDAASQDHFPAAPPHRHSQDIAVKFPTPATRFAKALHSARERSPACTQDH